MSVCVYVCPFVCLWLCVCVHHTHIIYVHCIFIAHSLSDITYTFIALSSSYAIHTHKNKLDPIANAFSKCFGLSVCVCVSMRVCVCVVCVCVCHYTHILYNNCTFIITHTYHKRSLHIHCTFIITHKKYAHYTCIAHSSSHTYHKRSTLHIHYHTYTYTLITLSSSYTVHT